MSKSEITKLVTEGFVLDQEIKQREERLSDIKGLLATAANDVDSEFPGEKCKATIGFHPSMIQTLPADKETKAKEIAGTFFNKLFCRRPIAKFKDVAAAVLGDKAEKLIELLSGPKSARVSFKPE
jgi:hypothetical protein